MRRSGRGARIPAALGALVTLACACSHIEVPAAAPPLPPAPEAPAGEAERFAELPKPWAIPDGGGEETELPDPSRSLVARAFARLGTPPETLGYRKDYLPLDPFRFTTVDRALDDPLEWLREDPVETILGPAPLEIEPGSVLISVARALEPYAPFVDAAVGPPSASPTRPGPEAADLSALPPGIAEALRPAVESAVEASGLVARAFSALSDEDREALRTVLMKGDLNPSKDGEGVERLRALWNRVDMGDLVLAASLCLRGAEASRSRIEALPPGRISALPQSVDENGILARIATPQGLVRVGGPGPSLHDGGALASIDLGGDDVYDEPCASEPARLCLILDLAGGDLYRSARSPGPGAGLLGVGVLLDTAGDDTYAASAVALGAGALGVGVLVDESGDDRYSANHLSEGAGLFGVGILLDRSGDDHYGAVIHSQGVGEVAGVGILIDEKGDDHYEAGTHVADGREPEGGWLTIAQGYAFGAREWGSGGVGLLWDRAGDDRYLASYFAQGGAYWYGLGLLVDEAGDDLYLARRYAQGAGVHAAVGMLWDREGNDSYRSWGVSQGCGHDLSLGILRDDAGDDSYSAQWLSQGAGNENGIGVLADGAGDDRYVGSGDDMQGAGVASEARGAVSFGFCLDGGGRDSYGAGARDDTSRVRGSVGVAVDAPGAPLD